MAREGGRIPGGGRADLQLLLFSTGSPIDVQLCGSDIGARPAPPPSSRSACASTPGSRTSPIPTAPASRSSSFDHARGRSRRPDARGPRPAGASGVLRRGGAAHPARPRRAQGDGATAAPAAQLSRRPRDAAHPYAGGGEIPFTTAAGSSSPAGPPRSGAPIDGGSSMSWPTSISTRATPPRSSLTCAPHVLPELSRQYPGVRWSFVGEQQEQRESIDGLLRGF